MGFDYNKDTDTSISVSWWVGQSIASHTTEEFTSKTKALAFFAKKQKEVKDPKSEVSMVSIDITTSSFVK